MGTSELIGGLDDQTCLNNDESYEIAHAVCGFANQEIQRKIRYFPFCSLVNSSVPVEKVVILKAVQ